VSPTKPADTTTTFRMLSSSVRNTAIFPTGAQDQPVIASMFGSRQYATISDPSQLAQSYESACTAFGPNASPGIHTAFGNSGFVSINFLNGNWCEEAPIGSPGADEGGNPTGFPVILQGTINNLVAYGTFLSGKRFRCLDTTDTSVLQDNTFVRAYYDLANDSIVLGSGTSQLSVTCSISIPAGDDVAGITIQWIKS
jgi:hypothetical protein